jgi:flagellar FliL protein
VKKSKLVLAFILVGLLMAGGSGAAVWWFLKGQSGVEAGTKSERSDRSAKAESVEMDTEDYKYVSLEKVIVMLRSRSGEPMSHYLSVDLVFKTTAKNEKKTKEHLPLLRSLAVRALSAYTLEKAGQMTVDQVANSINVAFSRSYAESRGEKPFTEAMIGKLIIE